MRKKLTVLPLIIFILSGSHIPVYSWEEPEQTTLNQKTSTESAKVEVSTPVPSAESFESAQPDVQENPDRTSEYIRDISETMKYLSVLIKKSDGIAPEVMEDLAKQSRNLTAAIKTALGQEIVKDVEESSAREFLLTIRATLPIYYGDTEGKYPKTLEELVPVYLQYLPAIEISGHAKTNKVSVIDTTEYDTELSSAIKDTGGWLYFSNPASGNWGMVIIDCSHKDSKNVEWYKY